jgi:hypothetical protein
MKPGAVRDLKAMLTGIAPVLSDRAWCFQKIPGGTVIPDTAFAVIREEEGACCILPAPAAARSAAPDAPHFARITLQLHSDLEGVGLTAAVATALATSGIACNVVAGLHHDHLFVPWDAGEQALAILERLSQDARR